MITRKWNYRLLARLDGDDILLQMHEVHYDKHGKPNGYAKNAVGVIGEDVDVVRDVLNKMLKATTKPILWYGDRFPEKYSPK